MFLTFPLLPLACKSRAHNERPGAAAVKTLEKQKVMASEEIPFELAFAKANGIPYKVFKDNISPLVDTGLGGDELLNSKTYRLRIVFGKISQSHYDLLMARYQGGKFVPYSATRDFEIVDFLPPKMQAFEGRWLRTSWVADTRIPRSMLDPRQSSVDHTPVPIAGLDMNCWAFAYEILRQHGKPVAEQDLTIGMFMNLSAADMFTPNGFFDAVKSLDTASVAPKALSVSAREKDLAYLDVLVLNFSSLLGPAHVAVRIDDNLYIEKTNAGNLDPFRLNTYEGIITPFVPEGGVDVGARVTFLRRKPGTELPALRTYADKHPFDKDAAKDIPAEIAGKYLYEQTGSTGGGLGFVLPTAYKTFPLTADVKTGRAHAKGSESLTEFFEGKWLCDISKSEAGSGRGRGSSATALTYHYRLDDTLTLFVLNAKTGVEVAKIKGNPVEKKEADGSITWLEFPSGGKTLRMYQKGEREFLFDHPGVITAHPLGTSGADGSGCAREPRYLR